MTTFLKGLAQKTNVKPQNINNQWALLTVFLLVVETLIGIWFALAESSLERVISGLAAVVVFLVFLMVVLRLGVKAESQPIIPQGLDSPVTPATKPVTEKEVQNLQPESMIGPDSFYIINRPPQNWSKEVLTYAQLLAKNQNIRDKKSADMLANQLGGQVFADAQILCFESNRLVSVIPNPGRTSVNGRKIPMSLEVPIPTRLAILPMNRWQPPFYFEGSFEHNAMVFVSGALNTGLFSLKNIYLDDIITNESAIKIKRPFLMFEIRQEYRDVVVNDRDKMDIDNNVTILGIQGDVQDHLVIMYYPSFPNEDNDEIKNDVDTLLSLANSFQPVISVDDQKRKEDLQNRANQYFDEVIKAGSTSILKTELYLLLLRLTDFNMDNPEERLKAIKMLKRLELMARQLDEYEEDDEFWQALHEAETGDASKFKLQINELIAGITQPDVPSENSQEPLPPTSN